MVGGDKKKIIVIGRGFLGSRIAGEFNCEVFGREDVDLLHSKQISGFLDEKGPDIIVNAAGITGRPNIDWCEKSIENKIETIRGNIVAPINLASECAKRNIFMIHFGSGCIYAGDNNGRGWSEKDTPNFTGSLYSRTKIYSENILAGEFTDTVLVIRIRMPIDERPHERNFIDKVAKYEKVLDAPNSMTTVPDMISALEKVIEKHKTGVLNFVNPGVITPAEIMGLYRDIVKPSHTFEVITDRQLREFTVAARSNCVLDTSELEGLGVHLPEIHKAVKRCLINYKKVKNDERNNFSRRAG